MAFQPTAPGLTALGPPAPGERSRRLPFGLPTDAGQSHEPVAAATPRAARAPLSPSRARPPATKRRVPAPCRTGSGQAAEQRRHPTRAAPSLLVRRSQRSQRPPPDAVSETAAGRCSFGRPATRPPAGQSRRRSAVPRVARGRRAAARRQPARRPRVARERAP